MGLTLATVPLAVTNLSRMQFAVTAITHFLFVTTTVGMLLTTMIFEFLYAYGRGDTEKFGRLTLFFSRIFFFSFGTGVVTGLIMEFQFGMNWSAFTRLMGDVAGVSLAIESMISFFIESTIIGLWRFTWGKLPKRAHAWLGVGMLGASLFSVVWIIAINAFMQHPYGFHLENGRARLNSLITLLQNPQYQPEFLHVLFAILITGGFVTAGVSAWQILHKRDTAAFKIAVQIGLLIALPAAFLQPAQGDDQGAATAALQPMKFTAIEGRYNTEGSATTGAPWAMAALINEKDRTVKAVSIPNLGTYFGKNTFTGAMPGMNAVAKMYHAKFDKTVAKSYDGQMNYYPPVTLLFWTMHLMVYAGYFFTMFALFATIMLHRRKSGIEAHPKTLRALGWTLWLPYLTFTSGWIVAEVGRYPFVVYGLLTQYDAVSPSLTVTEAATSLAMFFVADVFLVSTMIYISHRTVTRGLPEIDGNYLEEHQIPDPFAKEAFSHA